MDITQLLTFTKQAGGSDLHLSAGSPPMIRVHGEMHRLKISMLTNDDIHHLIYDIMDDDQKKRFEEDKEIDFSRQLGDIARFRVNIFYNQNGEAAVFRTIPTKVLTAEELNLPPVLLELANREKGLVLVTGPTGSGKSTTLAAMVDYINKTKRGHILTIEDPIEFRHESIKCLVNQREVGPHTHSFANALRSALREDPDIILVGEMRDLETIEMAITAAETGHLVIGTMHTRDAATTLSRLLDVFPPSQQNQIRAMTAGSLRGIMCQRLLPSTDGGLVLAAELLINTLAVSNLIRESKEQGLKSVMQIGKRHGMLLMDDSLVALNQEGKITIEVALENITDKNIRRELGGT
ncbi:type IV pilus twitching motility protein PilT [candidate division KSB1 bacterium]|nr:type IV pilus twitching motility protein PilT [candidate division KSB1 bacterium]